MSSHHIGWTIFSVALCTVSVLLTLRITRKKSSSTSNTRRRSRTTHCSCLFFGGYTRQCQVVSEISSTSVPCSCNEHANETLCTWILAAKNTLRVCLMTCTLSSVCEALIIMHKNGIQVQVILDRNMLRDTTTEAHDLLKHDIPIRVIPEKTSKMMHHKFIVRDSEYEDLGCLMTGSLNFTQKGIIGGNYENVIITNDKVLVKSFSDEFDDIWDTFIPLTINIVQEAPFQDGSLAVYQYVNSKRSSMIDEQWKAKRDGKKQKGPPKKIMNKTHALVRNDPRW